MANADLYSVLGVARTASADEIRKVYRRLARKHHPDVNPGSAQAADRFKEITAAYEVLSDDKKRKLYDEFGEAALRTGFDPERARAYQQAAAGGGPGFGGFGGGPGFGGAAGFGGGAGRAGFGGFGGAAGPGGFGGERFEFDLEDLFGGGGFGGAAGRPRAGDDVVARVELDLAQALSGIELSVDVPSGAGGAAATRAVKVRIPPGADDGSRLRVPGLGRPSTRGGPPGDLYIEVHLRPHPHFRRSGLDLTLTLPVTLEEAYLGATVDVPTPDGSVQLRVPPRSQSGQRLRLRGRGVRKDGATGDLYAELQVRVPDREDAALAEAVRAAARAYTTPVRQGIAL